MLTIGTPLPYTLQLYNHHLQTDLETMIVANVPSQLVAVLHFTEFAFTQVCKELFVLALINVNSMP